MKTVEDSRLTRVAAICLALPEAVRADMASHAQFTVRKKVFAYFLNDHHGDGIVSVCARAFPGENKKLIEAHPKKVYFAGLHWASGAGGFAAGSGQGGLG
jgi:hypothetical protein